MVRRGRFSGGCQICRKRKIKCDRGSPACIQCLRSGWKCPQYADSGERMFQHRVTSDFDKTGDQKKSKSKLLLFNSSGTHLPKSVIPSINDRVIDFFLVTHAFRDSGPIRGCYEYLTAFLNESGPDKTLLTSLRAAALAAYAYGFHYPDLLIEARREFGVALRLVNSALSSPQATNDSTVISIILFSTFGALTSQTPQSLSDCESHTGGAMMITKLRGRQQLDTRPRLQLFMHICLIFFPNCLLHSTRIPSELVELREYAATLLDADDPAWKLSSIVVKVAEFRAEVKDGTLSDCLSIVEAATKLDSELSSLGENMSGQWRFETFCVEERSEFVLGDYYHVYSDLWVAHIWNILRTCRLLLHEEIDNQLKHSSTSSAQSAFSLDLVDSKFSARTLQQMFLDICASVPQYCGHLSRLRSHSNTKKSQLQGNIYPRHGLAADDVPHVASVYLLLGPLLIAGWMIDSKIQRDWIIDQCRFLGRTTGIQQGFTIADILSRGEKTCLASR